MSEPRKDVVIKVEERPEHAYFVHFDRASGELLCVREYKEIYVPAMGACSKRTDLVIRLAQARLGRNISDHLKLIETKGEIK